LFSPLLLPKPSLFPHTTKTILGNDDLGLIYRWIVVKV